ncbi:hypothetical protein AJ78_02111 [Emergomyces pasteurianus Ep9510]|uniref:Yippee domain-containing protein n=1 Tax=Emergomyces pasteurianus Ep9510 TaxID=1447872 RepID=A0A1J9QPL1_9EURO|nr:hypothetical protein AJ78_02111 [Emergomyces pasteurianus Ep9510]
MSSSSIFPSYLLPSIPFRRRLWKSNKTTIPTPKASLSTSSPSPSPSSSSTTTTASSSNSPSQGNDGDNGDNDGANVINPPGFLQGHKSYLRCTRCSADLCLTSQIISKGFTGRHGRAYLVSADPSTDGISIAPSTASLHRTSLPNTVTQQPLPRQLVTGAHTVSDITCRFCGSLLGWKYVAAEEESQKYKVGKFILETKRVSVCSSWENNDVGGGTCGGNDNGDQLFDYYYSQKSATADGNGCDVEFDSQDEEECEDLFSGMWSPWLAARRRRDRNFERRSFG